MKVCLLQNVSKDVYSLFKMCDVYFRCLLQDLKEAYPHLSDQLVAAQQNRNHNLQIFLKLVWNKATLIK